MILRCAALKPAKHARYPGEPCGRAFCGGHGTARTLRRARDMEDCTDAPGHFVAQCRCGAMWEVVQEDAAARGRAA